MKTDALNRRHAATEPAAEGFANLGPVAPAKAAQGPQELYNVDIHIPVKETNPANLMNLLAARGDLIKKALGIDDIGYMVREDIYIFPWIRNATPEEARCYTEFIAGLCRHAKESKWIAKTGDHGGSERYAMRCFLVRLGFTGPEYKELRKIMCRNFAGSAAYANRRRKGESV